MNTLLRSHLLWINLFIVAVLVGNPVLRQSQATEKLQSMGVPVASAKVDVSVELTVSPEQFHMSRLQQWGTMVGAQERYVQLRGVSADNLQRIARQSWVQGIRRL